MNDFLKSLDFFGIALSFHFKTKEKYVSNTGGIVFLIYIVLSLSFVIINFFDLIKRNSKSIISYKMQTPSTDTINFNNYSLTHAFGLVCSGPNKGEEKNYFDITINQVKLIQENGDRKYLKNPLNYSFCTTQHFFNKFNDSFEKNGLNQRYCFDDDITIRGLYTDEIYEYVELTVSMKKTQVEDYITYYDILTKNDCTFQLYHIDNGIDIDNFDNPIVPYIRQEFIKLNPINFNKMEIYYITEKIMTDKNYLFNNYHVKYIAGFSMFSSFSLYKGFDRFEKKPQDYDKLAKFFLRADTVRNVISRKYMKFTEFLANVSSLISGVYLFLYSIMARINKFYCKEKLMTKMFQFKDNNSDIFIKKLKEYLPNEKNTFNIIKTFTNNFQSPKSNHLKIKSKFKNQVKIYNNNNKSLTTEELINNNNVYSNCNIQNTNNEDKDKDKEKDKDKNKSILKRSFTSSLSYEKFHFQYNLCEILILLFCCSCFSWKKLKTKNSLFKKGEKELFLRTDILSYTKNMQILEILTYILLEPNQIQMIKFLSKPTISLNKPKLNDTHKVHWDINTKNKIPDNETKDFCQEYKKLNSTVKKNDVDKKLFTIVNLELDHLFE